MATQALYRKWRSQTFDEVIGQKHITQTLQNAIASNRIGHAYLFTGPRGTGKTSTARILAKAVNCTSDGARPCNGCSICQAVNEGRLMDLIEIDAASNTSVDDIRDLRDKVDFRPGEARTKFYIIDEVHMLSKSAFNALLKTLEEPPPHVIFVLATTEPEKIPATIMSRCQRFDFRRIKLEDVVARLQFIIEQEEIQAEEAALALIARQGGGSMRDSISLLDQLTTYGDEVLSLALVRSVLGAADSTAIKTLVDHLLKGDVSAGLAVINDVVQDGIEPKQFALQVLEYLRGLLLVKYDNGKLFLNLPTEMIDMMRSQATNLPTPKLLKMIDQFNQAVQAFKYGAGEVIIPQLPLELAFVESTTTDQASNNDVVIPETTGIASAPPATVSQPVSSDRPSPAPPTPPPSPEAAKPAVSEREGAKSTTAEGGVVMDLSLATLQEQWAAIGAELKRRNKGMVQGLLNSGQLISVHDRTIVVSFPSTLLKDRVDKYKPTILEALDTVLGISSVGLEFVVGEGDNQDFSDQSPRPSAAQSQTLSSTTEKKTTIEEDPLVISALNLGGKIKGTRSMDDLS